MLSIDQLEEKILRRIPGEILIFSAILAFAVWPLFGAITALFLLAGGVFSAISFLWLKQSLSKFLLLDKKKALGSGVAFYILRLVLILAIFLFIIVFFSNKLFAFAAGFSTVILVFLAEAARALIRMKKWNN